MDIADIYYLFGVVEFKHVVHDAVVQNFLHNIPIIYSDMVIGS